jgi:hypothetical protein
MQWIFHRRRLIAGFILYPLVFMLLDVPVFACTPLSQQEGEINVRNVDWGIEGDVVVISYDLIALPEKEYEVSVVLLREGYPNFRLVPTTVTGDVGTGQSSGVGRRIRWAYKQDAPGGLEGGGHYFEVTAEEAGGSNTLLYIAAGAAVVGGAVLLLSGKSSSSGGSSGPTTLPGPPTRP